ncbi:MAG TPA: enoyl-CoA hydratase/isomerase family protein [Candidatus Acidoferrales bacterium]|nr:enoyl-CoA hydratase/isomerase family protein [Candidatus Acidoferrales bacterium]
MTAETRQQEAATASTIDVRTEGRATWITFDRPPLNVLDTAMMRSLSRVLTPLLDSRRSSCEFLVFRGAGERAFSAGAEVADHTPDRVGGMLAAFHQVFRQLERAECVTIAAVRGHCLGGGMELASFCDFVVAEGSAEFGQPEIKLGCFPPVAMVTLPALIGPRAAMDLILTGRTISAAEAQRLGIVTRIAHDGSVEHDVQELISSLKKLSPAVLELTLRTMRRRQFEDFDAELAKIEQIYLGQLMKMEDAREGVRAFLEKRPASWRGR